MPKLPDIVISGKMINQHVVYGWRRKDIYLYIGQTLNLLGRFASHHIIARMEDEDNLDVWICPSYSAALKLEKELIRLFKPVRNIETRKEVDKIVEKLAKDTGMSQSEILRIKKKYPDFNLREYLNKDKK